MIARALVALGGTSLTREDLAEGKLAHCEQVTLEGEGADWPATKTAANIPANGFVMHWMQVS